MQPNKEQIAAWFQELQDDICTRLEKADGGGSFHQDLWKRPQGGGGRTRIFQGKVIEKGGVNFSAVHGPMPEAIAQKLQMPAGTFFATGVSIVLHPHNPWVPIIHMNVRYFEMDQTHWWFGGGIDLTPHYIDRTDAAFFHQQLKSVCDAAHPTYYDRFKSWADDYFFLKHREETRGVGGIFFDHLDSQEPLSREELWHFVQQTGKSFAPIYTALMDRHQERPFTQREKNWQYLRRGRYVEFNLVWDRGTKFGLETGGRTESILMSLPPQAQWQYDHQPEPDSPEAITLSQLQKGVDWIHQSQRM